MIEGRGELMMRSLRPARHTGFGHKYVGSIVRRTGEEEVVVNGRQETETEREKERQRNNPDLIDFNW